MKNGNRITNKIRLLMGILCLFLLIGCQKSPEEVIRKQLELGHKYLEEMKYEEAVIAFNKVIEIDPKVMEAYVGVLDARIGLGDVDEAVGILEILYKSFPEDDLKEELKNTCELVSTECSDDYERCIEVYKKILEIESDLEAVYLDMAELYEQQGMLDEAVTVLTSGKEKCNEKEQLIKKEGELKKKIKEKLLTLIREKFSEEPMGISYDDFDLDGRHEIFAYGLSDDAFSYGVWFCEQSGKQCEEIYKFEVNDMPEYSGNGFFRPKDKDGRLYFCPVITINDNLGDINHNMLRQYYIFGVVDQKPTLLSFDEDVNIPQADVMPYLENVIGNLTSENGE